MNEPAFTVRMLPGALEIAAEHLVAGQQLDNLCGCHWGAILLRSDGFDTDAEALAALAGTVLPGGDPRNSVPELASPRVDYRIGLPLADRPEQAGTSIGGLAAAVATVSGGRRDLVPLDTQWTAERVVAVLELCRAHPAWAAVPIANLRTGRLWGSRLGLADAMSWLAGAEVAPPAPDWDVGHFVTLAGTWDGPARTLVIIRDSYPVFGWDGHHLQPPEALAYALARGDGRAGGIALYVSSEDRPEVERVAKEAGFQIASWDNGTPWPPMTHQGGAEG